MLMIVVTNTKMKAGNVTAFNWATGEGKRPCYIWTWAKKMKEKILKFWFGSEIVAK